MLPSSFAFIHPCVDIQLVRQHFVSNKNRNSSQPPQDQQQQHQRKPSASSLLVSLLGSKEKPEAVVEQGGEEGDVELGFPSASAAAARGVSCEKGGE